MKADSLPIPRFFSPELQKAVEAAHPHIAGVDEFRNQISADIKTLEAYLQSTNLTTEFSLPLRKYFEPISGQNVHADLEFGGSASGTIAEEALGWAKDDSGRFRLMHELRRWQGEVEIDAPGGPYFWDEASLQLERRPLLETKFELRQKAHEHLGRFVKELARQLGAGPELTLDPDLPF